MDGYAHVVGNIIESNTAARGAGIYTTSSTYIGSGVIACNIIRANTATTSGGGVYSRARRARTSAR